MVIELNVLLCGLVLSQAILLGAMGVIERRASPAAPPLLGLALAFSGYALTPLAATLAARAPLQATMLLESFLPVGFWYVCEALFDDRFSWRPLHAAGALAMVVSLANVTTLSFPSPSAERLSGTLVDVLKGLHVSCILLGLKAALSGWRDELVAVRLRVRLAVVAGSGCALLGMILARYYLVEMRALDRSAPLILNPLIFAILFGANLFLVLHRDLLRPFRPPTTGVVPAPTPVPFSAPAVSGRNAPGPGPQNDTPGQAEDPLEGKLTEAMGPRALYKTEGLTIAGLAAELRVPEYRLRAHINGRLGFRNFNQYIAHYRIAQARELLSHPDWRHEKVLSVALEVGYASLAPFNKAFKDATGLTPSEYRDGAQGAGVPPRAEAPSSATDSSNPANPGL